MYCDLLTKSLYPNTRYSTVFLNLNLHKCNNCNTAQLLSCDFGDHHCCQHLQSGENPPDCGICVFTIASLTSFPQLAKMA